MPSRMCDHVTSQERTCGSDVKTDDKDVSYGLALGRMKKSIASAMRVLSVVISDDGYPNKLFIVVISGVYLLDSSD